LSIFRFEGATYQHFQDFWHYDDGSLKDAEKMDKEALKTRKVK
jgi:hypothetical protein